MKYKVGDQVKIRSWSDMEQEFGMGNYGHIKVSGLFIKRMKRWCDKVVTIKIVRLNHYRIKEDEWSWFDDMINHNATKIMSIIDRLEMLKKLTTNKDKRNVIDTRIKNLNSNNPVFNKEIADYYNNIFAKLKIWRQNR